jgi:anti-sigma regulatory factor (Ser/Thr protein kinase)
MDYVALRGHANYLGESLSALRDYIGVVGQRAGLPAMPIHRLKLAADEIATNIILYGYADASEDAVLGVRSIIEPDKLTLILEDSGSEYDPTTREIDLGQLDDPLETRPIGGLGVFLAIRNVDEFTYARQGNLNINRFVVLRPAAS